MKNKMITQLLFAVLFLMVGLTTSTTFAQNKMDTEMMKDCCMMKDGKMMQMKDGKLMRMKKKMIMENGTKCKPNGVCVMKDGSRMKMKEGNCMDSSGSMDNCSMMVKGASKMKSEKQAMNTYTCPMHPEVKSDKPGKCPKCNMDLVQNK